MTDFFNLEGTMENWFYGSPLQVKKGGEAWKNKKSPNKKQVKEKTDKSFPERARENRLFKGGCLENRGKGSDCCIGSWRRLPGGHGRCKKKRRCREDD